MDSPCGVPFQGEFAALVGIDWADQKHDVCLLDPGTGRRGTAVLEHTPEAIDEWVAKLRDRFAGRPVAVCLEQSKGALAYALLNGLHSSLCKRRHPSRSASSTTATAADSVLTASLR